MSASRVTLGIMVAVAWGAVGCATPRPTLDQEADFGASAPAAVGRRSALVASRRSGPGPRAAPRSRPGRRPRASAAGTATSPSSAIGSTLATSLRLMGRSVSTGRPARALRSSRCASTASWWGRGWPPIACCAGRSRARCAGCRWRRSRTAGLTSPIPSKRTTSSSDEVLQPQVPHRLSARHRPVWATCPGSLSFARGPAR